MQRNSRLKRTLRLFSRLTIALIALTLLPLLNGSPSALAAQEKAAQGRLRVVHAIPDAGGVDVYINRKKQLTNVPFFTVSDYLTLKPGDYRVQVVPTGVKPNHRTSLIETRVHVRADRDYSFIARGTVSQRDQRAIRAQLLVDINKAPEPGQAKLRVGHFSPDAPAVDIYANGAKVISALSYRGTSAYLSVPAGTYTVGVAPAGGQIIYTTQVTLQAGQVATAWANGLLGGKDAQAFKVTPSIDATFAQTARLRAVHAVPDIAGSPVDVYVNGSKAVTFDFFDVTDYLEVPAGPTSIQVVFEGGDPQTQSVISATVNLTAGKDYSAIARGTANANDAAALGASLLEDDNTAPASGQARLRVAHFSPDAPAVDIYANGNKVVSGLSYLGNSAYLSVPAGTYTVGVAPANGAVIYTTTVTLEEGDVATAWANGLLGGSGDQAFKVTPSIDRNITSDDLVSIEP